jgi:membrane fusion protein, multidrug efflux system
MRRGHSTARGHGSGLRTAIWGLAALVAVAGCSGGASSQTTGSSSTTATVESAKVEKGSIREILTTFGTVVFDPHKIKTISFERSGKVQELLVTAGQAVSSGDVLLVLGPLPEGTLEVQQSRIDLQFAESDLARLQRQLQEQLATNDQVQQAQRRVSSARASLQALGVGTDPMTLEAPFAGIVSDVNTTSGALVKAGETALALAPATGVVVRVGFEIEDAASLATGLEVSLEPVFPVGAQGPARGRIGRIHQVVDPATQLVEAWVVPSERPSWMVPGTRVRVAVAVRSSEDALKIPLGAVMTRHDERGVFVVAGGVARWTPIITGIEDETSAEVLSGLQEGAQVVTTGRTSLEDGMTADTTPRGP